jgi:lipoprotein-releasing system ATP-binding protein
MGELQDPSTLSAPAVLCVENVSKDFGERSLTRVLFDVNLVLNPGEFTALVGPSGSGKSTLLNLIGLLDRPSVGRVLLQGEDTGVLDEDALTRFRGKTLGFIFQAHLLLPAFTCLENVVMPGYAWSGFVDLALRERARQLLIEVGLVDKLNTVVSNLSGGQQQRVAIARALAHHPPLVLADEPTGNLDTKSSADAFELMRRFNREMGTTFLVVTHDLRIAAKCDREIEIVDGRITRDETRLKQGELSLRA